MLKKLKRKFDEGFLALLIFLLASTALLFAGGCAGKKTDGVGKKIPAVILLSPDQYPDFWDDLSFNSLNAGIAGSLEYLERVSPGRTFRFGADRYSVEQMRRSLIEFSKFFQKKPSPRELRRFIIDNCRVYKSVGGKESGKVLFTGYYEPALRGSLFPSEVFKHPVYGPPDDLTAVDLSAFSSKYKGEKIMGRWNGQTLTPYYDRRKIDFEKVLYDRVQPLVYVDDLVDLFFLHIQGSGKIYLQQGGAMNLHYHSTNGRPYRSIGKYLIDQGKVDRSEMSMQKIRQYLEEHPEEIHSIFSYNPSYVFFEIVDEGPLGALGVKLTPGRAIAIDRKIFPDAALAFIQTKKPLMTQDREAKHWIDFSRFVLNQDTGGAIRGPARADIFWGNGPYAEIAAGYMRHPGNLYFLVLKPEIQLTADDGKNKIGEWPNRLEDPGLLSSDAAGFHGK